MAQNGRTSFIAPDSEGRAPTSSNGGGMLLDAHRRRDRLIRRESARRNRLVPGLGDSLTEAKSEDTERAAQFLCDSIKAGRVTLAQVEQDQREDASRLAGWRAIGHPQPGTPGAETVAAIQRRMTIRNRALELHALYDITSATAQTRPQTVPDQPAWKPWRKGAAPGGSGY